MKSLLIYIFSGLLTTATVYTAYTVTEKMNQRNLMIQNGLNELNDRLDKTMLVDSVFNTMVFDLTSIPANTVIDSFRTDHDTDKVYLTYGTKLKSEGEKDSVPVKRRGILLSFPDSNSN